MIYKSDKPYHDDVNSLVEELLFKGKALPVGTVRNWSGKSWVKQNDGEWVPVAEAKNEKPVESIEEPSKPAATEKESQNSKSKKLSHGTLTHGFGGATEDQWYIHDDKGEKIGSIEITKKEGVASLTSIRLAKDQRGKGLGRQALQHLVSYYGQVTSDYKGDGFTSDDAKKMWEALGAKPGPGKALYSLSKDQVSASPGEATAEEKAALKEYQSGMYNSAIGGYANIQSYLRTGKPKFGKFDDKEKKLADEVAKNVSSAIKKHPLEKPMTVYRGMKISQNEPGSEIYQNLKPGDTIQDPGFTSTSTNKNVANKFSEKLNRRDIPVLIEVNLKQGDHALPMDKYHKHDSEKEILLDRNVKFKVISVTESKGIKKIKLEIEN